MNTTKSLIIFLVFFSLLGMKGWSADMKKLKQERRPSPKQYSLYFNTKQTVPPDHKIYTCDKPSPVRAVAEFEEMGGVLIAYPGTETVKEYQSHPQLPPTKNRAFGIPDELIIKMQQLETGKPVHIFIMCNMTKEENNKLLDHLAHLAKSLCLPFDRSLFHFIPWDTDTYWTRDFGPWWIQNKKTGIFSIAKHIYTTQGGGNVGQVEEKIQEADTKAWKYELGIFRPNDDYGAVKVSDYLNFPINKWNQSGKKPLIDLHYWYFTGLLEVGGNYMVNGKGAVASSYLVASQNILPGGYDIDKRKSYKKSMEYIIEQLNGFMGLKEYMVLSDPEATYIGHIDCWGKFLSPNKVLIAHSVDKKTDKKLNHIANWFKKQKYEVFRVLCQPIEVDMKGISQNDKTAAYTNSLILNKSVYVPIEGCKYKKYDEDALAVYQKALPGYKIIGVIGKPVPYCWLGTDALHCRTHGIPRQVVDNWLKSQGRQ